MLAKICQQIKNNFRPLSKKISKLQIRRVYQFLMMLFIQNDILIIDNRMKTLLITWFTRRIMISANSFYQACNNVKQEKCNIFLEDQLFYQNQHFLYKSQFSLKSIQLQFYFFYYYIRSDGTILQTIQQLQNSPIPPLLHLKFELILLFVNLIKILWIEQQQDQINYYRISQQFYTQRRIRMEGVLNVKFKYHAFNEFVIFRGLNTNSRCYWGWDYNFDSYRIYC
ncbi:unnamed protein product [Paramecium octaurelia]|uniref:Uncharacterized protein n=1 Tax=Paramecium octaurelia TaxID=43137 RepID=A0A8S1TV03_PAROT|nr:unnamed protein product [Paramecium octaurelia]